MKAKCEVRYLLCLLIFGCMRHSIISKGFDTPIALTILRRKTMKPEYELNNVSYNMFMRGGGDVWGIFGSCPERMKGRFMISTPISFNKDDMVIESHNSIYHIKSWSPNSNYIKDRFWEQVAKDIVNGYEVH